MFVDNETRARITLAKGHVGDTHAMGAIVVESVYRVLPGRLDPTEEPPPREPSGPPDIGRAVAWREVSVTASGTAHGPPRPPYVCPVTLTVGREMRRLIVFGPRRYKRAVDGDLEPSTPDPFDGTPVTWELAYGGAYAIPPGLAPGSGLPHPGLTVRHPMNPLGVGLYPDREAAADQPVPSVERPDQLIKRWSDRPTPAGFAPCPALGALRMPRRYGGAGPDLQGGSTAADVREAMRDDTIRMVLRMQHHAPGDLVFREVPVGTVVALAGLGRAPLQLEVPASPVRVGLRARKRRETIAAELRSLHLDADRGTLTVVHGHAFDYDPADPPSWIHVTDAS